MLDTAIHALAYAWGKPAATGRLRQYPEDFQVTEIKLLEPDGEGEHGYYENWLQVTQSFLGEK